MGVYFWLVVRDEGAERQHLTSAAGLRMLAPQFSGYAAQAAGGKADAFQALKAARDQFQASLAGLEKGAPGAVDEPLGQLSTEWKGVDKGASALLSSAPALQDLRERVDAMGETLPQIQTLAEEVAASLRDKGEPASQVYFATRQGALLEQMGRALGLIASGQANAATIEGMGTAVAQFGNVLTGMLDGNFAFEIQRVTDKKARQNLDAMLTLFNGVEENHRAIADKSADLTQAGEHAAGIAAASGRLTAKAQALEGAYQGLESPRFLSPSVGYFILTLLGVAAALGLLVLGYRYVKGSRESLNASHDHNERNQQAILRLLDEMGDLANGDLTVSASVTEDFTGAIADSINYAVEQLRNLVSTINETSERVSAAAQETQATALHLAEASQHQAQEISTGTEAINEMAQAINNVSTHATESAAVARQALQIAEKGGETVRNTIKGMDAIREHIQETSKRIKRLGESSQEIGNIVSIIEDIAEQTNILALNAAIQASSAGEAGRGFAVVADEVQRLAERSGNATKQIEALVKTIQGDTNEAVISMEQSTEEVVKGARLAQDAGVALEEINAVSRQLARLFQDISGAASGQATTAVQISSRMRVIQEFTHQTLAGTNAAAESVGMLADLANELRRSVAGFKLPDSTSA
jgi:twitching motility protein PilJ